jgi:hypothetical protein
MIDEIQKTDPYEQTTNKVYTHGPNLYPYEHLQSVNAQQ